MTDGPSADRVVSHHGREGLAEAIETALRPAGLDPARLTPEDLHPVRPPGPWRAAPASPHRTRCSTWEEASEARRDLTETALAWVRERLAGSGPGPLGLHLLTPNLLK